MPQYRGTVQVKGRSHSVDVDGNYAFRTSIRVDGLVVATRGPMNLSFAFPFRIDGVPVTMRWIPVGLSYECRVIADQNVALSPLNRTGESLPLISAEEKARRNLRIAGFVGVAVGILLMATGAGLEAGQSYSPTIVALGPVAVLAGVVCAAAPRFARRLNRGNRERLLTWGVIFVVAMASRFLFVPFFIARFARP
jgi:uncharacterized protein YjeT (DUF2065 family)